MLLLKVVILSVIFALQLVGFFLFRSSPSPFFLFPPPFPSLLLCRGFLRLPLSPPVFSALLPSVPFRSFFPSPFSPLFPPLSPCLSFRSLFYFLRSLLGGFSFCAAALCFPLRSFISSSPAHSRPLFVVCFLVYLCSWRSLRGFCALPIFIAAGSSDK